MTMGQYWLGKIKPKQAFRLHSCQIDPKCFRKVAMEILKSINGIFYSLTNYLTD